MTHFNASPSDSIKGEHSQVRVKKTAVIPPARKCLSLLARIVGILVISFVSGEVSIRIFNYFQPSYIFYSESYNKRFRGKPFASNGKFHLNSLGFNDKEFTPKSATGYRIVALGDSFAFGVVPYDANYLTLIETALQKNHPNADVLNMGIIGTGPVDYWDLLKEEGLTYQPDMVLLSFFIGNDFVGPRRRRLYEFSYLSTLFYRAWKVARSYQGSLKPTPSTDVNDCDDCPTMTEGRYLKIENGRSKMYVRGYRRFDKSVDTAMTYLEKIRALCKERKIRLVVVLIPDELQINRDLEKTIHTKFHSEVADSDWDITLPNRTLAARLTKSGIDNIDLYDSFRGVGVQKRLYKPRDSHWDIAGNQLAANVIGAYIEPFVK
jgi:SGNH hydrolase-like domain, acetyltransferase AlgX